MNFHFNLDLALELFPLLYFSFRLRLDLSCAQVSLEDSHAQSPWWPLDHVSHPSSAKLKRLIARINSSVTVVRYSARLFGLHWNYWVPAIAKKEKSLPTISRGELLLCYTLPRHSGVKLQLSRHNPLDRLPDPFAQVIVFTSMLCYSGREEERRAKEKTQADNVTNGQ